MRVLITGGSGFVGRNIIPIFEDAGVELLLCGRDLEKLASLYPDHPICTFGEIPSKGKRYDVLLHLAVLNNNSGASLSDFRKANVDLTLSVVQAAREAGINRFIFVSSTHALDPSNTSFYAISKREAADAISAIEGVSVEVISLPYVYGEEWGGKLKILNSIPFFLSRPLFRFVASLKPTVHVKEVARYVLQKDLVSENRLTLLADDQDENKVYIFCKRFIDVSFAILCGIFLSWLFVLTWLVIKLQSDGPSIFAQSRVGKEGKIFTCYKFRTMKLQTVQVGTHEVAEDAVTPVGKILRKTKIDELPQIFNILRNEMSLVGPRPCLPVQNELVDFRHKANVFSMKPGITGLAQINGVDMSNPAKLTTWDVRYCATRTLLLDFKIVIFTFLGRGLGDRVKRPSLN